MFSYVFYFHTKWGELLILEKEANVQIEDEKRVWSIMNTVEEKWLCAPEMEEVVMVPDGCIWPKK